MADWYVSSTAYAAIPVWQATHAYVIGDIIRPVTPGGSGGQFLHTFRCTTAGTSGSSEPNWGGAGSDGGTVASGGATFTNVTGRSTSGWSAAAGSLYGISNQGSNRPVAGDRVFLSSDHSETYSVSNQLISFNASIAAFGLIQFISVNRAGSVPPVLADILSGAAIAVTSNNLILDAYCNHFWQGITFTVSGTFGNLNINANGNKNQYFKNCAFALTNTGSGSRIAANSADAKIVLDNTTIQFGHIGQFFSSGGNSVELVWLNTPSAIAGAIIPTSLFATGNVTTALLVTCRGVDLSAITTSLALSVNSGGGLKVLLDSCRIAAGVARYSLAASVQSTCPMDEVELVNCYDGTNVVNERHTAAGDVNIDRSVTLSSGAQDDIGNYSLKMTSSSRADQFAMPLDNFAFDVENAFVGVSKTATVEIISSASLNNNDIRLALEYQGTSGSSLASFLDSLASVLTPVAALPTSSNTWSNPPSTPVKQLLQVTFTPQKAGRVRGLVRLGKPSATVWVNPQIAIV